MLTGLALGAYAELSGVVCKEAGRTGASVPVRAEACLVPRVQGMNARSSPKLKGLGIWGYDSNVVQVSLTSRGAGISQRRCGSIGTDPLKDRSSSASKCLKVTLAGA